MNGSRQHSQDKWVALRAKLRKANIKKRG
jgi:hypothetical protein